MNAIAEAMIVAPSTKGRDRSGQGSRHSAARAARASSQSGPWKPTPLFIVEFNGTRNVGRLPPGNFTQEVVGSRFRVSVSPDFQVNSYVQYDNDSRLIGTNTRLRWTFSPVGDLFVVYNHNVRELLDASLNVRGRAFDSNQLIVKLQYAFRY